MPRADPPVGTRGRPFRDRLASGFEGRSQLPLFRAVFENVRMVVVDASGFEDGVLSRDVVQSCRKGRAERMSLSS